MPNTQLCFFTFEKKLLEDFCFLVLMSSTRCLIKLWLTEYFHIKPRVILEINWGMFNYTTLFWGLFRIDVTLSKQLWNKMSCLSFDWQFLFLLFKDHLQVIIWLSKIKFFNSPCYKFASSSTAKQPYTTISTFSLNKSIFKHIAWGFFHAWVQLHYSHLFPCTRLFSSGALVCFPPLWLARIVTETGWHCLNSKPR